MIKLDGIFDVLKALRSFTGSRAMSLMLVLVGNNWVVD